MTLNLCPHCKHIYDNEIFFHVEKIEYTLKNKQLSYQIRYGVCRNCGNKIYPQGNFPLLNLCIKYLFAAFNNQNKLYKYLAGLLTECINCPVPYNFNYELELYDIINELLSYCSKINSNYFPYIVKSIRFTKLKEEKDATKEKDEEKISSLTAYISEMEKLKSENRFFWFRGQPNKDYDLIPSIFRVLDDPRFEVNTLQYFMMRAPAFDSSCPAPLDYVAWLPFMQHYGVSTRLLDWTDSPLCALFFAITDYKDENDAAIFVLDPVKWNKNYYNKLVPILEMTDDAVVKKFIDNAFGSCFEPFMLYPMAVTSIRKQPRMLNQKANFTIHDSPIDMYKMGDPNLRKIIISGKHKKQILKELNFMGIDKTTFFPELPALADVTKNLWI